MFTVTEKRVNGLRERSLIDTDRDAVVEYAGGHGRDPGRVFVMRWRGRRIPFDAYRDETVDPITGETYYLIRLGSVGASNFAARSDEPSLATLSEAEKAEAHQMAIEAVLDYFSAFRGLEESDGYNRVLVNGTEIRMSDVRATGAGE